MYLQKRTKHPVYKQMMDSANEFQSFSLNSRNVHKTYLVTYSQANRILFPTRESFEQSVVDAFNKWTSKPLHWASCLENHQNGGNHYHCSVKLGSKCWKAVKDTVNEENGIQAHFSDAHDNYWSVLKYSTKSDPNVSLSPNPNMQKRETAAGGVL